VWGERDAIVAHKDRPYALARKTPGASGVAKLVRRALRYLRTA